jgi:hypothetical protein
MKKIIALFIVIVCVSTSGSAQLKIFAAYYRSSYKDENFRSLKGLPVKVDSNNCVYIRNQLIYEPKGTTIFGYEVMDKKYIFISLYDTSYQFQSIPFQYWYKTRIIIISIKNPDKRFYVDIKKRCRSEGVLCFYESGLKLQIKDKKTSEIIDLPVQESNYEWGDSK